jgi:glycosidase
VEAEGFWQEFRQRVKNINPEAYIVGEIWCPAEKWLDGTQFDGVMNYQFTEATIAFCGGDRILREYVEIPPYHPYPALNAPEYAQKIENLFSRYDWQIHLTQLNLLASHDTARLLTVAGGDIATVELSTLLLLTFPGAPSIYYGDEVGLPGGIDPDSRRSFPKKAEWNNDLLNYHKELIKLRNQYPALRRGDYQVLYAYHNVYIFSRNLEKETIIVALNNETQSRDVKLNASRLDLNISKKLFGTGGFLTDKSEDNNTLIIQLQPRSGMILLNK